MLARIYHGPGCILMGRVQTVYGLSPCGVSICVMASCLAAAVGLRLRHEAPCHAFDGVAGINSVTFRVLIGYIFRFRIIG